MTTPSASIPLVSTIFGLTYLALAIGKIPGLRIDRAGIALVGAAAMLACGVLSMHDAAKAVDYETIVLLFGMMVVVIDGLGRIPHREHAASEHGRRPDQGDPGEVDPQPRDLADGECQVGQAEDR